MAHQEEEARRSRVVVNTPTSQREVVRSEAVKYPEREGVSGGVLAAIVVGVVALAAIAVLFLMNRQQQDANANVASQPPQTTIVQQPAQQPPVVVQPPAPATQPAPVIFNNPPASTGTATSGASNDSSIQAAIDKKLSNDPNLSSLGIYATVVNGKATITGTVRSEA